MKLNRNDRLQRLVALKLVPAERLADWVRVFAEPGGGPHHVAFPAVWPDAISTDTVLYLQNAKALGGHLLVSVEVRPAFMRPVILLASLECVDVITLVAPAEYSGKKGEVDGPVITRLGWLQTIRPCAAAVAPAPAALPLTALEQEFLAGDAHYRCPLVEV